MRRALAIALLAGAAALPGATAGAHTGAAAAKLHCHNLRASKYVKQSLYLAHVKVDPRARGPKPGSTYYGRCGRTWYALASFRNPRTGYDDQPEGFRARGLRPWKDLGDNGCTKMPKAMLRVWHYRCPQAG